MTTQLDLVDVVTLHAYGEGTIAWGSSPASHQANLTDYGSLIYRVRDRILVAVATPEKIDGRSDPHARRLREDRRRVSIPDGDLDTAWSLTATEAEGQRVAIYTNEGVVALRLVEDLDTVDISDELVEDVQGTAPKAADD